LVSFARFSVITDQRTKRGPYIGGRASKNTGVD
jgi:hypothetical protein